MNSSQILEDLESGLQQCWFLLIAHVAGAIDHIWTSISHPYGRLVDVSQPNSHIHSMPPAYSIIPRLDDSLANLSFEEATTILILNKVHGPESSCPGDSLDTWQEMSSFLITVLVGVPQTNHMNPEDSEETMPCIRSLLHSSLFDRFHLAIQRFVYFGVGEPSARQEVLSQLRSCQPFTVTEPVLNHTRSLPLILWKQWTHAFGIFKNVPRQSPPGARDDRGLPSLALQNRAAQRFLPRKTAQRSKRPSSILDRYRT